MEQATRKTWFRSKLNNPSGRNFSGYDWLERSSGIVAAYRDFRRNISKQFAKNLTFNECIHRLMPPSTRRQVLASAGVLLSVGVVTGNTTSGAHHESSARASRTASPLEVDGRPAQQNSTVETVATDLEIPWGTDFAPDGTLYFTERPGRVNRLGPTASNSLPKSMTRTRSTRVVYSDSRCTPISRPRRTSTFSRPTRTAAFHSASSATASRTANSNAKP